MKANQKQVKYKWGKINKWTGEFSRKIVHKENGMLTSSKNTWVFRRMCLSSVSSKKLRFNASAFWLTSRNSFSSFSNVACRNDGIWWQFKGRFFSRFDSPPSQSFHGAEVPQGFHRCQSLGCHPSWFPFPNNAIYVPFHRNVSPR